MKKIRLFLLVASLAVFAFATDSLGQRGGRGGGGRGGFSGGGFSGAARPSGGFTAPARPAVAPQAGFGGAPRTTSAPPGHVSTRPASGASGIGPGGGTWQSTGPKSGTITTKGGSTIEYKGAAIGGTTAGGATGGKYIGGVQVTTPGGQTINKASKGAVAQGPGGNVAGKKTSVGNTYGAYGSGAAASRSGFVAGPGGVAATKAGVAVGPGGAAAGRTSAAVTSRGTYYRSAGVISGQGAYVRAGFAGYYGHFTAGWYGRYPGAWFPGKWAAASAWAVASWAAVASYTGGGDGGGYPAEPVSYDYGSNVAYQEDGVYVNGENVGAPEQYAQQATEIAQTGKQAETSKNEEFLPLGVFAMVQGEETTSSNIFELAVSKTGVIRGNYYNALTDTAEPVYGSIDKKTQRAAWTVGEKKAPVYEAGIVNLTNEQTTMMVHYSKDKSQQFTLFRIEKPKEGEGEQAANGEK